MPFKYLKTERDLGAPAPVRLFDIAGLGIDQDALLSTLNEYSFLLEWDDYDVKFLQVEYLISKYPHAEDSLREFLVEYYNDRANLSNVIDLVRQLSNEERLYLRSIRPRRKRSIARVKLSRVEQGNWNIVRLPASEYQQNVGSEDLRTIQREFKEMSRLITTNDLVVQFLYAVAEVVRGIHLNATKLEMTLHRMYVVGDAIQEGSNSYEGMHQDGADYIVSAMVINRHEVIGGESIVCDETGEKVWLRHTLKPGQGIFQADARSSLWHDVTPIKYDPSTPALNGYRDILGLDINVIL